MVILTDILEVARKLRTGEKNELHKPKIVLLTITSYMIINMNKDKHSTKF